MLIYGKYTLLDSQNPDTYAYTREINGRKLLILLNFRSKAAATNTGIDLSKANLLIDNYGHRTTNGTLRPYEAAVYELK